MKDTIKYAKNKGYCYDNRHLFSELRKLLLKEKEPLISKKMTTIQLHKMIEDVNKEMANEFIEKQFLKIPYLGNLYALERNRYYNIKTKRTNIPVLWGKTRQMKRDGELDVKKVILNTKALRLIKIMFKQNIKKGSFYNFRVCQDVATRLFKKVTEEDIPLPLTYKYSKEND